VRKEDAAGQRINIIWGSTVPVHTGEVGKRLKEKGSQNKKVSLFLFLLFSHRNAIVELGDQSNLMFWIRK
jgi:hypothetical protein